MTRNIIVAAVALASFSVIVMGIRDVLSFSAAAWVEAGRNRRAWVWLMVGIGPLAVLLYWGTIRFDLIDPQRFDD